jgi:hypothetical protein
VSKLHIYDLYTYGHMTIREHSDAIWGGLTALLCTAAFILAYSVL